MEEYYVYIISNQSNTVLYIGITNNLKRRIYEYKEELVDGFSKKYRLEKLVYFEQLVDIENAILREKQLKKWNRKKKNLLVNKLNSEWRDLYYEILD
ncbi:MAG: GIY-YIG nuclease family protein [Xanthomonadales bacterium]|jgi:putative endonuclease|nr:GIY-YIG nuclease family protein [Xanthomonadales bacterium]